MISKHLLSTLFFALTAMLAAAPAAHALVALPSPPIRPAPPPGYAYQWVSPTYRTVVDRTWIPARTQLVQDWIETSPGRFEQVWREITTPGHYESTTRQVLINDGYWQLVRLSPPPRSIPQPNPIVILPSTGTVGVEGYAQSPTEDLSKFSPLSTWPDNR